MQNKQIRQPGSHTEIIRNCIRYRPEAEPNQSYRSALTVCVINAVLSYTISLFLITMSGRKNDCVVLFLEDSGAKKDWV